MKRTIQLLAAVSIVLAASSVHARELFVSPSGRDKNDCMSPQTACRQMERALNIAQIGDRINLANGYYPGFVIQGVKGTSAQPIRIRGRGSNVSIVPAKGQTGLIQISDSANIFIERLKLLGSKSTSIRVDNSARVTIQNVLINNGNGHGIQAAGSHDLLIANSQIYSSANGDGIHITDSQWPVVRDNLIQGNKGAAIRIEPGAGETIQRARIEYNIISGNGEKGGAAVELNAVTESLLMGNLFYDNKQGAIRLGQGGGDVGPSNMRIFNNTVQTVDGWCLWISESGGNIKSWNNIFVAQNETAGSLRYRTPEDGNIDAQSNIFSGNVAISADDGATRMELHQWQAQGRESNSKLASPDLLFVSYDGKDFLLAKDSPAINSGKMIDLQEGYYYHPYRDLRGYTRPQDDMDVGAFERSRRAKEPDGNGCPMGTPPAPVYTNYPQDTIELHISFIDAGGSNPPPVALRWIGVSDQPDRNSKSVGRIDNLRTFTPRWTFFGPSVTEPFFAPNNGMCGSNAGVPMEYRMDPNEAKDHAGAVLVPPLFFSYLDSKKEDAEQKSSTDPAPAVTQPVPVASEPPKLEIPKDGIASTSGMAEEDDKELTIDKSSEPATKQ